MNGKYNKAFEGSFSDAKNVSIFLVPMIAYNSK